MTDYASDLCPLSIPKSIAGCTVESIPDQTYNGTTLTPDVTVKDGDVTLTEGMDYTVSYENNVNAGTATAVITGVGGYIGELSRNFTIGRAEPIKPTDLTGVMGQLLSTVSLPDGWEWDAPKTMLYAAGEQTFKASYKDDTGNYNDVSGVDVTVTVNFSGGGYIPTVQKPVIEGDAGAAWTLNSDGTKLTISAREGYTLFDVTLNGTSKGQAAELTGLKTGDKVVIRTVSDADVLAEKLAAVQLIARSKMSAANGLKAVKVYWFAEDGSDISFDGYEVFRSTKRYSGFGKTPIFETGRETYWNTAIKSGTTYYYKVRGYIELNDVRYYTGWSKKAIRTVK